MSATSDQLRQIRVRLDRIENALLHLSSLVEGSPPAIPLPGGSATAGREEGMTPGNVVSSHPAPNPKEVH